MPRYDPSIRGAVRELNRIPGVRSRASCQGRFSAQEQSTHADLAYVLFRDPLPLALEEDLLERLADVARIDSDSVYSQWPERNAEFCHRLEVAARGFGEHRRSQRWMERRAPLRDLLDRVEAALRDTAQSSVVWCLDCDTWGHGTSHAPHCRSVMLLAENPSRRLGLFQRFLAEDSSPPDSRLREREGDQKLLDRVGQGDFGDAYRRAWGRFEAREARRCLRGEARERIRHARREGTPVDFYFQAGKAVLAWREG